MKKSPPILGPLIRAGYRFADEEPPNNKLNEKDLNINLTNISLKGFVSTFSSKKGVLLLKL